MTMANPIATNGPMRQRPSSLTARLLWSAVGLCALVGVVYVCWWLLPEIDMGEDSAFIALALYSIFGGLLCAVVGISVGLSAAVGNCLATGSSATLSFYVMLLYAGIDDLDWLLVVLGIVLPAALCLVVHRWSRATAAYESQASTE
jgi:hypothetical protein